MEQLELVKENMQPLRRGRTLRPPAEDEAEAGERERTAALDAERRHAPPPRAGACCA